MFKKFPPDNPCGTMVEEIIQPKRMKQRVTTNKQIQSLRISEIIHALNLQARHDLAGSERRAGSTT